MITFAMSRRITCVTAFVALALGCVDQAPPPDNRAADEAAIMQADAAWSEAAGKKDLDAIMSAVADDTVTLGPNAPTVVGKETTRTGWESMLALPGFSLSWKATKAVAARSGDLGYSYGTYELSMTGPDGNPVNDNGKYLTIWAKQADGTWQVAADIYNTDMPLPPPPAAK